jgi:protein-tyrosine phosphatase
MIRRASLILTMTHEQRAEVLRLVPSAVDRTFTLKEFARTLANHPDDADRGDRSRLVARVARRLSGHSPERHDDLADPYGGPAEGYATMIAEADAAVRVIAERLTGGGAR